MRKQPDNEFSENISFRKLILSVNLFGLWHKFTEADNFVVLFWLVVLH